MVCCFVSNRHRRDLLPYHLFFLPMLCTILVALKDTDHFYFSKTYSKVLPLWREQGTHLKFHSCTKCIIRNVSQTSLKSNHSSIDSWKWPCYWIWFQLWFLSAGEEVWDRKMGKKMRKEWMETKLKYLIKEFDVWNPSSATKAPWVFWNAPYLCSAYHTVLLLGKN